MDTLVGTSTWSGYARFGGVAEGSPSWGHYLARCRCADGGSHQQEKGELCLVDQGFAALHVACGAGASTMRTARQVSKR